MAESEDRELHQRCIRFMVALERELAERVVPFGPGFALLSPNLPLDRDSNYLLMTEPGMEGPEIAEWGDRLIGGAGMDHRTVWVTDDEEGARLRPWFEGEGWEVEQDVQMVLRREPDREGTAGVREVKLEEVDELRLELLLEDEDVSSREVAEQILEGERRRGGLAGDRWFVAPDEGEPASLCCLLARGGVGQIEDVATLERARGKGLARATILAAAEASRAEEHDLTFIAADTGDWPKELYQRLGFDPVGFSWTYYLWPNR